MAKIRPGDLKMAHRAERGTYDPVELGLSMAKNGVSSVKRKKNKFLSKKWALAAGLRPAL